MLWGGDVLSLVDIMIGVGKVSDVDVDYFLSMISEIGRAHV